MLTIFILNLISIHCLLLIYPKKKVFIVYLSNCYLLEHRIQKSVEPSKDARRVEVKAKK